MGNANYLMAITPTKLRGNNKFVINEVQKKKINNYKQNKPYVG